MVSKAYRSANVIIQSLLETIIRSSITKEGIVKSRLISSCRLKPSTAEKYLLKMEKAGYIESYVDYWGERTITLYRITTKGMERYKWFVKINAELEEFD